MTATVERKRAANYFEPLLDCLTPEVADRILDLRADDERSDRLDLLADKKKAGTISIDEKREYESMVYSGNIISLIQGLVRNHAVRSEA